jgi:DNA-damage-inducible protein J
MSYIVSQKKEVAMAATSMVHVRVDENVKAQAAETLATMGLSISDAVRVLLVRVAAEKQLPFELKAPNATTRAAMAEAEDIVKTRRARFQSAEEVFNAIEEAGRQ